MIYSSFVVFLLLYFFVVAIIIIITILLFFCHYNDYHFSEGTLYCHRYYTSQSIISMLLLYTKNAHGYYYYYTYSRSRPGMTTVWRNQKNVDGVARLTINARSL